MYAKLMKIKKSKIPDIALEIISNGRKNSCTKMYGVFYEEQGSNVSDLLYINVAKHDNEKAILYTIVHELVHRKYPELKHGKKFDKIVDQYFNKSVMIEG